MRKTRKHDITTAEAQAEATAGGAAAGPAVGVTASAVSGLLAAAVALGIGQLAAAATGPDSSPVVAVGSAAIDLTPPWLKDFAVATFGSSDKLALLTGIFALLTLTALAVGLLSRRHLAYGLTGIAAFGALGLLAAVTRPTAGPLDVLPSVIGTATGMATLTLLLHVAPHPKPAPPHATPVANEGRGQSTPAPNSAGAGDESRRRGDPGPASTPGPASAGERSASAERGDAGPASAGRSGAGGERGDSGPASTPGPASAAGRSGERGDPDPASVARPGRRGFLVAGLGVAVVAGVSGGVGQVLQAGVGAVRAGVRLPRAAEPAAALPAGSDLRVPGLTPFLTPPADFYRVDTALVLPKVDPHDWNLRVHGLVDRPVELSLDDLLRLPLVERYITLTCVSNQVGGQYAGTGRWLGVRLSDLLRRAGIRGGADQILSRSTDGFTAGTPVATVMDGRDALLAVGLDGAPLPVARGFPARLVVPGLYGFVSATKWVTDLKITRFADDRAYWARRGWAVEAPIKTMSRIDVPAPLAQVKAGDVTVAGVAWAQHRGIARVEVRVDDGPWRPAELAAVPSADTWRQWRYRWSARTGRHTLTVRATDRTGAVQTPERVPPIPDGASGWQSIVVTVA